MGEPIVIYFISSKIKERLILRSRSFDPASVTIEAGKVQLDLQDENAQLLQVLAIKIYDSFNATTRLHNIALLEVTCQSSKKIS